MRFRFPPSYDLAIHHREVVDDAEARLMMSIVRDLWLKDRTLVSDGFRESLEYLAGLCPLEQLQSPSGEEIWTWPVPKKWTVREAWLREGDRVICDYQMHPLHLASYSTPVAGRFTRDELLPHLVYNPDRPNAVPFVYHYYESDWSFCISYNQFLQLGSGPFEACIDTLFEDDHLRVGEWVLPGESDDSIVLYSHLCHPGQANDGLSGVAVGIALMQRLAALPSRRYTYRLVLGPENIGSVCYLHNRWDDVRSMKYGVILEMLGNKNHLKLQTSKRGDSEIDRLAELVLQDSVAVYGVGEFRQVICNDEINFDGPGVDIPTICLSRWPYPEYHTSDDSPDIISPRYMKESLEVCWRLMLHLERNTYPMRCYTGNLFLSKFGLYEDLNLDDTIERVALSFDGTASVLEIAERLAVPLERVQDYVRRFDEAGLVDLNLRAQ